MAFDPRSIDESPLFKLLTSVVVEGPGIIAGKIGDFARGFAGAMSGASEGRGESGGLLSGLKDSIFGGREAPVHERAVERAPAVEVAAPAPSLGKYEVSMNELGSFAPPTFNGGGMSQGTGMRI